MNDEREEILQILWEQGAIKFGQFKLKPSQKEKKSVNEEEKKTHGGFWIGLLVLLLLFILCWLYRYKLAGGLYRCIYQYEYLNV